MRLINTRTLRLESFFQGHIPAYAILSHTWGPDEEEITYQDFQGQSNKQGIGLFKLEASCGQARDDGLLYIWNDTCCIDKTNSTELSEAINSMFQWYSNAERCYAYLEDVPYGENHLLAKSRWFTRGWTLQELLAPRELVFYSGEWKLLGTRKELASQVEKVTGIPRHFLVGIADLSEASVAQRMSWAANRVTKRREDVAYSLLGIFGVTMPMIYGEGNQAFMRLQEEIMRRRTDDSILAWGLGDANGVALTASKSARGVLARKPADFEHCGFVVSGDPSTTSIEAFNALGGTLRVSLPLYTTPSGDTFGILGSHLNHDQARIIGIPLRTTGQKASNAYIRPQGVPAKVFEKNVCKSAAPATIHIHKEQREQQAIQRRHGFYIEDHSGFGLEIIRVYPQERWQKGKPMILATLDSETGKPSMQRTWVRLRAKGNVYTHDLILVLELEAPVQDSTTPVSQCHLMVSDLGWLSRWDEEADSGSLGDFNASKLISKRTATISDDTYIEVDVVHERVGSQPMFVVKIASADNPLTVTASWDRAIHEATLQRNFIHIIEQEDMVLTRKTQTTLQLAEEKDKIKPFQSQLANVEEKIRALEAEKRSLTERRNVHEKQIGTLIKTMAELEQQEHRLSAERQLLKVEMTSPVEDDGPLPNELLPNELDHGLRWRADIRRTTPEEPPTEQRQ